MYDFDTRIDRRNTGSVKVDLIAKQGFPEDTIPLWVRSEERRVGKECG